MNQGKGVTSSPGCRRLESIPSRTLPRGPRRWGQMFSWLPTLVRLAPSTHLRNHGVGRVPRARIAARRRYDPVSLYREASAQGKCSGSGLRSAVAAWAGDQECREWGSDLRPAVKGQDQIDATDGRIGLRPAVHGAIFQFRSGCFESRRRCDRPDRTEDRTMVGSNPSAAPELIEDPTPELLVIKHYRPTPFAISSNSGRPRRSSTRGSTFSRTRKCERISNALRSQPSASSARPRAAQVSAR
jgi:hypothetical protein